MEIVKAALAGTLESSDAQVSIEPGGCGIELTLESSAIRQYGKQIRQTILDTLKQMDVTQAKVKVVDKGALDCTLKARVECAVLRSAENRERLSAWIPTQGISTEPDQKTPANIEPAVGEKRQMGKKRLRRTMMFLNCQKPGLLRDPYIYGADSLILDLEDAVAAGQKDAARCSLYHALRDLDYRGVERVVRINGLDTPYWKDDIRVCVAGGADAIRISKTETAGDVKTVEAEVLAAEREFCRPEGSTLLMAALESAQGVLNALEICRASERLFGIALSGGDFTKDLQTTISSSGIELAGARQHLILAARAAKVQCFDTVYTDLDDMAGFQKDVETIHQMGFDGKSVINPKQIGTVHQIFTPKEKEIRFAEKVVRAIREQRDRGIGVFTVDGKMIDIAFYDGALRTLNLAKAAGILTDA